MIALLRVLGVRVIVYIDDMLILAETREMAQKALEALTYLLESLGDKLVKVSDSADRVFGPDDQYQEPPWGGNEED